MFYKTHDFKCNSQTPFIVITVLFVNPAWPRLWGEAKFSIDQGVISLSICQVEILLAA